MEERNELYPVFLKVHNLQILIVGGGKVALEKLSFLLKSSPNAKISLVAPSFDAQVIESAQARNLKLIHQKYDQKYLSGMHMVIATTDDTQVNIQVYKDCRTKNILVNVADNPPYCDFYMGGIVTKGNVKIGISTNGKSPTTAKRLRQFFEEVIPDDIDELVKNLNSYRETIKGDFGEKVEKLNEFTKSLVSKSVK